MTLCNMLCVQVKESLEGLKMEIREALVNAGGNQQRQQGGLSVVLAALELM